MLTFICYHFAMEKQADFIKTRRKFNVSHFFLLFLFHVYLFLSVEKMPRSFPLKQSAKTKSMNTEKVKNIRFLKEIVQFCSVFTKEMKTPKSPIGVPIGIQ